MDIDKQVIFDAVIDQDASWQDLVNAHWECLNYDDRRRILVLASGGGGGSVEFVAVPAASADPGSEGQFAADGDFFYVYVGGAINEWRRAALSAF